MPFLTLLFSASIVHCPSIPALYSKGTVFEQYDLETLRRAERRCVQLYPASPCVKLMMKPAFRTYRIVCGSKPKETTTK